MFVQRRRFVLCVAALVAVVVEFGLGGRCPRANLRSSPAPRLPQVVLTVASWLAETAKSRGRPRRVQLPAVQATGQLGPAAVAPAGRVLGGRALQALAARRDTPGFE